jgi:hypothetical protein
MEQDFLKLSHALCELRQQIGGFQKDFENMWESLANAASLLYIISTFSGNGKEWRSLKDLLFETAHKFHRSSVLQAKLPVCTDILYTWYLLTMTLSRLLADRVAA